MMLLRKDCHPIELQKWPFLVSAGSTIPAALAKAADWRNTFFSIQETKSAILVGFQRGMIRHHGLSAYLTEYPKKTAGG